jgi:uncharacterized protein YuzE
MRFTYDDEVDALYVSFREDVPVARSDVLEDGRVVDFDDSGRPIGVEILGTSTGVQLEDLAGRFGLVELRPNLQRLEERFRPLERA